MWSTHLRVWVAVVTNYQGSIYADSRHGDSSCLVFRTKKSRWPCSCHCWKYGALQRDSACRISCFVKVLWSVMEFKDFLITIRGLSAAQRAFISYWRLAIRLCFSLYIGFTIYHPASINWDLILLQWMGCGDTNCARVGYSNYCRCLAEVSSIQCIVSINTASFHNQASTWATWICCEGSAGGFLQCFWNRWCSSSISLHKFFKAWPYSNVLHHVFEGVWFKRDSIYRFTKEE